MSQSRPISESSADNGLLFQNNVPEIWLITLDWLNAFAVGASGEEDSSCRTWVSR